MSEKLSKPNVLKNARNMYKNMIIEEFWKVDILNQSLDWSILGIKFDFF